MVETMQKGPGYLRPSQGTRERLRRIGRLRGAAASSTNAPPCVQSDTRSSRTLEQCDISDSDLDAEEPNSVPQYDLPDDVLIVLGGKIKQKRIDSLRRICKKAMRLRRRLQAQPNDEDATGDRTF